MKVYVDFEDLDIKDITDNALIKISRKAKPELCECVKLSSLVDHDKRVRKQVCDEIREKLKENGLLYTWKGEPKYKTMEELLDQIEKGE